MERILVSIVTGPSEFHRLRAERVLCSILRYAPRGAYLRRDDRGLCIAVPDSHATAPKGMLSHGCLSRS